MAADHCHAQDRQGRRPLLRPVRLGRRPARDDRRHPQSFSAAHLHRRGFRNRSRPCLEYQIKRCLGPCCLPVDREEYGRHLHAAQMLLEGKNLELLREMRDLMKDHASRLEFEQAARIRDRVRAIEKTVERQTVLHHWGIDQDVFGIYREGGYIEAIVLIVRGGKLTSTQGWSFQDLEFPVDEILSDLLTQYYSGARNIPDEVIVPVELEDADVRGELLSERRGKKCEVFVPQRGEKLRLLEMAMDNARQSFASRRDNEKTREKMLEDLRVKLGSAQQRPSGWNATTSRICRARWWSAPR